MPTTYALKRSNLKPESWELQSEAFYPDNYTAYQLKSLYHLNKCRNRVFKNLQSMFLNTLSYFLEKNLIVNLAGDRGNPCYLNPLLDRWSPSLESGH